MFKINVSADLAEIGAYPQIVQYLSYKTPPNLSHTELPERSPNMGAFKLDDSARVTELLSSSFYSSLKGFFMASQLSSELKTFSLIKTNFYNTELVHEDRSCQGAFMHVVQAPELVDFDRSTFVVTGYFRSDPEEAVDVNSLEEWRSKQEQVHEQDVMKRIVLKKVVLTQVPDVFRLPLSADVLVSNAVRESILQAGLTGVTFEEPDMDFVTR
jgi:hypothetical protein